ncbi:histone methyltransferase DOT1 PWA37_001769 [Arxiozyma heterogenica]|uniref:histone methyltransferase DOT1 n=1 Tax=Arxiozyma heterogenica TaxID=278026 RepID=UPI002EE47899
MGMDLKDTQNSKTIHPDPKDNSHNNFVIHDNKHTRMSYNGKRPITPVDTYPTPESGSLSVDRAGESVSIIDDSFTTNTNNNIEPGIEDKNVNDNLLNGSTDSVKVTLNEKSKKKKRSAARELESLLEDASRYDPNFEYSLPTSYKRSKPRKYYFNGDGNSYSYYDDHPNIKDLDKMGEKFIVKQKKIKAIAEEEREKIVNITTSKQKKHKLIQVSKSNKKKQKNNHIENHADINTNSSKLNNFMKDLDLQKLKLTNLKAFSKKKTVVTIEYIHLNKKDKKSSISQQSNRILSNKEEAQLPENESKINNISDNNYNNPNDIILDNTSVNNISTFLNWDAPFIDICNDFFNITACKYQNFSIAQTCDSITVTNHIDSYKKRYHPPNLEKSKGYSNKNTIKNNSIKDHVIRKDSDDQASMNQKQISYEDLVVELQNPLFFNKAEKFRVNFSKDVSRYNPMVEVGKFIEYVALIYLPDPYSQSLKDDIIPKLNEAYDISNGEYFVGMVKEYNNLIQKVPRYEIINHLKSVKKIPVSFIHDILQTVYIRTIYPRANQLKHYEAFSNYVYGELLPNFLSKIYKQCNLNQSSIFLDLGSGVGNCVIQAALEYQCKLSAGCEIMKEASDMTEYQHRELQERCKIMGLNLSPVKFFLKQSFVANKAVENIIRDCDVLLINNFLFDAELNKEVEKLIQNVKVGCKIISLKSLRRPGYVLDFYNTDNILSRLKVEKFNFEEDSVSWTHTGGEYYISTVLESIDESLLDIKSRFRKLKRPIKYTR